MKLSADQISKFLFFLSLCALCFGYGLCVGLFQIFPYHQLREIKTVLNQLQNSSQHYRSVNHTQKESIRVEEGAYPGVNLVTSVTTENRLSAKLMDMQGETIHEWIVDWFTIWPDDTDHIRGRQPPQSRPGTEIHGAVVMPNGDLVFNFNDLGLVRLNPAGEVVWRLPYQTHHSVYLHDDGKLWVSGLKVHEEADPKYPNYEPPFDEFTLLEISGDGKIEREISVFELLQSNDLQGLMYLGNIEKHSTVTGRDTLHLNDVECFPAEMSSDFFQHGDIMISLRNINSVLVFNPDSLKVKFACTGMFVRQHDPDFIDGNTISVFDNNHVGPYGSGVQSRIVAIDAPTNGLTVKFAGNDDVPFYTDEMGKHQWLPNGNLLVTESVLGRAFELNPAGEVVWEYINYVAPDQVGYVTEVTRLPFSIAEMYSKPESK